jgi:hypothetical protein
MTTTASDLSVVLSGGISNINPNLSLGGDPSSTPVLNGLLNNLFDDVTSTDASVGVEDYRCIYIFNDGDTTIWNVKLFVTENVSNSSYMELGIYEYNETQRITIIGPMTGGQLVLLYKGRTFTVPYDPDLGVMSTTLQTELQNLTINNFSDQKFFKKVFVIAQAVANNTFIFDVKWLEKDAKRNFDKISLDFGGNQLTPSGNVDVSFTTTQEGSPVNSIANEISLETNPPGNIGFFVPSEISPIIIPFLDPNDGFPLWIKRTVPTGAAAQDNDGFTLRITAESLEPLT